MIPFRRAVPGEQLEDLPRPSRRWASQRYRNIVHWGEPPHGGHFAALERPEEWVGELRSSFRRMR